MKHCKTYMTLMLVVLVSMSFFSHVSAGDFQAYSTTGVIQAWDQAKANDGNLIQLIMTSDDTMDPPNADTESGALGDPTGDDVLLRLSHIGNGYILGFAEGRFSKLFSHDSLAPGTKVYIRAWSTDVVASNNDVYGDSELYTIQSSPTVDEYDFGSFFLDTDLAGNTVPVELSSFAAHSVNGKVELTWTTQTETQNLGYYIFRSETANGTKVKLNEEMIEGALNSETRNDYSYTDDNVEADTEYFYWLADVATDGAMHHYGPISVLVTGAPKNYSLDQNYPNPFNPTTKISYTVKSDGFVSLVVYNMLGQIVQELVNHNQAAGTYAVQWNGLNSMGLRAPSGVYFYSIDVNGFTATRKMMLTK